MIVTVTPNPAVDLTWRVPSLMPGHVHRADAGAVRAGGKGLNVARVAHTQGAQAVAVATAGGATGEEFAAELADSGVPHVLVPVAAATRRSLALVDESAGDTSIVNEYGTAPTPEEWDALADAVATALGTADAESPGVLVISGSLPPGTPENVLPTLIGLGRDAAATVIVDTSGPSLLVAADAGASVLKPNQHELRDATGLDDPVDGARELLRRGTELVLLSLGPEGMLAVSQGADVGTLHARLDAPLAGNPTGAGDAAVAACAVMMDAGIRDPERILRRATAWSAAAVLMPLAGEIHASWPDLEGALTVVTAEESP
ncbi:hexose kinase [Microbacterium soli]|uniref:1-phosphofructokinase family hexose kinase n=1 Tax=Microbacterium soli TaxID=446075 RepID=A0ABP7N0U3_9MICO